MNQSDFWLQIKEDFLFKKYSNNKALQTFLEPTELLDLKTNNEGTTTMKLGVPSELHKYYITQNILKSLQVELSESLKQSLEIQLEVVEPTEEQIKEKVANTPTPEQKNEAIQNISKPASPQTSHSSTHNSASNIGQFRPEIKSTIKPIASPLTHSPKPINMSYEHHYQLNNNYSFSTFVVGRNNEFAHAACYSISENPASGPYNPLFIFGPTGMGKTHLINSVGNHIIQNNPSMRICYVSAERFLNDCVSCIRRGEMHKFREKYRHHADILLMDDIQILSRGEAVQDEFFHTLNEYLESSRQVVVASDRMPKDIKGLEDRIRTRLEWGLIADIQMPDMETRVAILNYKAEQRQLALTAEVIHYIARISKRSIRELEGNLNKVEILSRLQGVKITLDLCKQVLSNHDDTAKLSVEDICKMVCEQFNVRMSDLKSKSRQKPIVTARQFAMTLIKTNMDISYVDIGKHFGGKDHTTVINAVKRTQYQLDNDLDLRRDFEYLQTKIHNITGV